MSFVTNEGEQKDSCWDLFDGFASCKIFWSRIRQKYRSGQEEDCKYFYYLAKNCLFNSVTKKKRIMQRQKDLDEKFGKVWEFKD